MPFLAVNYWKLIFVHFDNLKHPNLSKMRRNMSNICRKRVEPYVSREMDGWREGCMEGGMRVVREGGIATTTANTCVQNSGNR